MGPETNWCKLLIATPYMGIKVSHEFYWTVLKFHDECTYTLIEFIKFVKLFEIFYELHLSLQNDRTRN